MELGSSEIKQFWHPLREYTLEIAYFEQNTLWKVNLVLDGDKYFPKGILPRATSQVAIFHMCNFPSGNFLKVWLGIRSEAPQAAIWAERCDLDGLGKLPLGKLHI